MSDTATQGGEMRDADGRDASEAKEWNPVHASDFEPMFADFTCSPLIPRIPRWVTPNDITMLNMWTVLAGTVCSVLALETEPLAAWVLRIVVALCIFASAVLDCLDGEYARATKQSSKFGEVLDHWVDSWDIPLTAACTAFSVCTDNLNIAVGMVTVMLTYNSQVKLYHLTGKFIMPNHSGALGQCTAAAFVAIAATITYAFGRTHSVTVVLRAVAGFAFQIGNLQNLYFYYYHTRKERAGAGMMRIFAPCLLALLVITAVFLRQNQWIDVVNGSNVLSDSAWPIDTAKWCSPLAFAILITTISGLSSGTTVVCAVSKTEAFAETPVYVAAVAFVLAQVYTEVHEGPFSTLESLLLFSLPYLVIVACWAVALSNFRTLKRKMLKAE